MAQGIDVRQTTDRLHIDAYLLTSAGAVLSTDTTTAGIYEVQDDATATLKSYDFNDNTFKTTALTTATVSLTHKQGNNATVDTGYWSVSLTTLTGFTVGKTYLITIANATASPPNQMRKFQFGNAEGDMTVTAARLNVDIQAINADATAADRLDAAFDVAAGAAGGLPLTDASNYINADLEAVQGTTAIATRLAGALAVATGIDINQGQLTPVAPTADTVGEALRFAHQDLPNQVAGGASGGLALAGATKGNLDQLGTVRIINTTSTASSSVTQIYLTAALGTDTNDDFNGMLLIIYDASDSERPSTHLITDYTAASNICDITPNCRFTPANLDRVEIWPIGESTVISELQKLTTGFSLASPDNLISHLRAMMSKAATTPAGVGTYSAATDSLELHAERIALVEGAGFATSTDSLQAIRDAIDLLVAPAVVTSTSVSGSGFISDCIGLVRRAVDEPSTAPKYTNADINEFIHAAYGVILSDMNVSTDHPILVRFNVTLVDGQQTYNLPPNVAQLLRIAKMNTATGLVEWEVWPGNEFSGHGQGFTIEGNTLRLLQDWNSTETLQLLYIPNAEVSFHKGSIASGSVAADVTATTLKFATTPTDGELDPRPNSAAGMMIRLLSSSTSLVEERIVTAYAPSTRIATINQAWDSTPAAGTAVVYELVPQFSRTIKHVVCLRAAIDILAQEGNAKRMSTLNAALTVKMAALRRYQGTTVARWMHHANGDTMDNLNLGY